MNSSILVYITLVKLVFLLKQNFQNLKEGIKMITNVAIVIMTIMEGLAPCPSHHEKIFAAPFFLIL